MVCRKQKFLEHKGEWLVYITVEKEVEERNPKTVLVVDLGIRWMATTVNSLDLKPKFYGEELRKVKGHYFWLRRTLQLKKAYRTAKNIEHKEKRMVNNFLHRISKKIVYEALENDSVIVLGDLKGIRRNGKGRGLTENSMDSHTIS